MESSMPMKSKVLQIYGRNGHIHPRRYLYLQSHLSSGNESRLGSHTDVSPGIASLVTSSILVPIKSELEMVCKRILRCR